MSAATSVEYALKIAAALAFGGAFGLAAWLAGTPIPTAVGLTLPLGLTLIWAEPLRARAGLATVAGGWVLAALLMLACLAVLAGLGVPAIGCAVLMVAAMLVSHLLRDNRELLPSSSPSLILLLLLAALPLAFWGDSLWHAPQATAIGGPQRIWQDWYFHGVLIDMLGQGARHPVHDLRGVDLPLAPYHYLSYGLVGWLSGLGGVRGIDLAFLVWWPLGMLLLLAAASEWVFRLRPDVPWLALALPLTLFWPDAAGLGSGQAFLGWHWLQTISPGSLYGSVVALLLASWLYGRRHDSSGRPVSSLLVLLAGLAMAMLFKAQVILLAAPLLLFWWGVTLPGAALQRRMVVGGMTLLALLVLLWIPLPGLPLIHLGGGGWREYWPALLHLQAPGWLAGLREPAQAPLVILLGTLGWTLIGVAAWPRAPHAVRVWMLLLLGGYLLYALGLDLDKRGSAGTPEELHHRPLVWVLPMWWLTTAPFLLPWSAGQWARRAVGAVSVAAILAVGCLAGLQLGPDIQRGPEKIDGRPALPGGLVEAAAYIRKNARPGDVCQSADADPGFRLPALAACAPYWVGFNLHPRSTSAVRARAKEWQRMRELPPTQRLEALRRAGIRWYSAGPLSMVDGTASAPDDPRLPMEPAFQSGDAYVVYQLLP
ncbi:hypothetical protein [Zoogloea sp.]|uniref:hypothetical protein n=1 Tax=Zoogloea sp. TaxID=49181 RepID=UPI00321FC41F